jgi:outer membrane autotransporter protein
MDSSNGEADRFDASGTVDLAGVADLNILNPGWAVPGTYQTTIVTGVGGATDSGLSLGYQASAVMNYSLLYPNSTDVVLSTNIDFNSHPGLNHNQRAIGEAVNTIQRAGGSSSFAPFVAELVGLPDVQAIGEAYDSMSPESYDAMATTTFEVTQQYTQTLVKRMHSIRSYLDTTGLAAGVRQIRSNGLWVSGFGETGDLDANNSFTGFDYNLGGIGIGLDRLFKDGLLGGISYGQSRTTIDLDSNKGDGAIDSYVFSLYGSFFSDRYYLDTALSYAKESYENRRRVEVGALSDLARSNHDGDLFSFYTEAGYNFEMHKWLAQPFAALQYGSLDEERYRESGAGGASLIVDKRKTESLVTDLGLRFNRPFKKADLVYIPEISAAWRHDYDIDERGITAAFDGSPGVSFTTESRNIDKDGLLIGVGIALLNTSGMSMDLRYDFETRGDYSAQRIAGGLRYEF